MTVNQNYRRLLAACCLLAMLTAWGCATPPASDCRMSDTRELNAAIQSAQDRLQQGCVAEFDRYVDQLLEVAAGDPDPDNKQAFSDFLVWTADTGLLSRRQAQATWNRYFNVKFVSMRGDYNNCAQTCPTRKQVLKDMEQELADKERGMLQAALDREGYYRADRLLSETELVLEATCRACEAGGR
jgi:hypothetical protein